MERLYCYVGPSAIAAAAARNHTARTPVSTALDVRRWIKTCGKPPVTATFIIDQQCKLWIANRRSEHVACARGGPVLAAGEMTFEDGAEGVEAVYITNQSTGFCPEPESWAAVECALNLAGIAHAGDYDQKCEFRLCECGQINIVKDRVFECGVCAASLPSEWNFDAEAAGQ